MTIYQIKTATKVYDTYETLEDAKLRLREYAIDRRNKFGVRHLEMNETGDSFSYLLGWEEVKVKFWIETVEVQ